jgi:hypothetical protein
MSCNSCSNITLPVVPGPAGAPGAAGNGIVSTSWTSNSGGDPQGTQGTTDTYTITYDNATTSTFLVTNGANGQDGIAVIDLDTVINNTTSATYDNVKTTLVVGGTLVNVGDFLRVEADIIGAFNDTRVNYNFRVKFGTVVFLETVLYSDDTNASKIVLDLIVTATDEITPYISAIATLGDRAIQYVIGNTIQVAYLDPSATATIDLTTSKNLEIDLKSNGTENLSLTHYKLIKYKKLV